MIRRCPSCGTERPLTEPFCEGVVDGRPCGWRLVDVPITKPAEFARVVAAPPTVPAPAADVAPRCPSGHPVGPGSSCMEMMCLADAPVSEAAAPDALAPNEDRRGTATPNAAPARELLAGWRLERPLSAPGGVRERFVAVRATDGRRAVLTLYREGAEPDPAVYEALRSLDLDHVPEIIETGRWEGRVYEVTEELTGGTLADVGLGGSDLETIRRVAEEVGRALHAFAESGLRHRDLRPSNILARRREPLDLVVTGFSSARLSELDLDIVSPLETSRYMAPEAVMGGVSAASDWWSLGMLLLERVTGGACFEGVSEPLFLIHVLTDGAPIPRGINPTVDRLLHGLLARDRTRRWQWKEVRAWLAGEDVPVPEAAGDRAAEGAGASLTLGERGFHSPRAFAIEAARAAHWDAAVDLLRRGAIATWAEEAGLDTKIVAALRQVAHRIDIPEDLQLAIALKLLNPALPLIQREQIVSPGWLQDHPTEGYELVAGPVPELLDRLGFESEGWLLRLARRAVAVRGRAATLAVELDEPSLRIDLLASRARLAALWEERRRLMPDTEHPGLAAILDRPVTAEEDLVILVAATPSQFRPRDAILAAAEELARGTGAALPDRALTEELLARPRREVFAQLDRRIEGFARCGNQRLDAWADQFRLERRLPLEQALLLLAVPAERWQKAAHQEYVSKLLEFFEKRVAGAILRGPLVRMTIGKTTPRIDITELAPTAALASALLERLLQRSDVAAPVDPQVFAGPRNPEQRLRSLVTRTSIFQRDTGIDGMYLGFPFLLRRDRPGNVRPRLAPVLLWPVKLSAEVGGRGRVTLAFDRGREEVRLNPAFEGLLGLEAAARWREAANELLGRSSFRIAEVMDALGSLAAPRGRALAALPDRNVDTGFGMSELLCAGVLFHVEFLGQAIVEDLRHLKSVPPAGSALEAMLRLGGGAPAAEGPGEVERDHFLVTDSDPSQEEAIARAWRAPGLLVQGPPGTGKSQTIVNLIADAIGRRKSVLVVCQKLPALEVVRKRLVAEGLDGRLTMVTDINRDRRGILSAIRDQLEGIDARGDAGAAGRERRRQILTSQIAALEAELDRHHEALARVDASTGRSYRGILGELLALEEEGGMIEAPALRRLLGEMPPEKAEAVAETCGAVARDWLPANYEGSPLAALLEFPGDAATVGEVRAALDSFLESEARRIALAETRPTPVTVADPAPLTSWVTRHGDRLRGLSAPAHRALAKWITHFRRGGERDAAAEKGPTGAALIAKLRSLAEQVARLEAGAHDHKLFEQMARAEDAVLGAWVALSERATRRVGFWARMSPSRWVARRRLRELLAAWNDLGSDARMLEFHRAALLERGLRPVRRAYQGVAITLGLGGNGVPRYGVTELTAAIADTRDRLMEVADLAAVLAACPLAREADAAATEGAEPPFDALMRDFGAAIGRAEARHKSLAALEPLREWIGPEWVEGCARAIAADQPTGAITDPLLAVWDTVGAYQRFRTRAKQLDPLALQALAVLSRARAALEAVPATRLAAEVRRAVHREVRLAWKHRLEGAEPLLQTGRDEAVSKGDRMAELEGALRRLNREQLASGVDGRRIGARHMWADITRLQGPRAVRLREFLDRGAKLGLLDLRPVWLMNPDVASQLLPRQRALFDIVIYDEASQMPVEYALPTLFRAGIAMVSGDEKQMPPTSFFASKVENDEAEVFDGDIPDEDATDQERDLFEETWNRREIKDCPDLLHLAAAALPVATLQIHYRSVYRELIGFSNAAFYRDELCVPVRHPDDEVRRARPIHVIPVNGVYRDQTNEEEARRVVGLLAELWAVPAGARPSVGVVTFNRKQADLVEEALEARAEADPAFREAYSHELERVDGGEDMGVFVKNVENVQGDERDVIIFSTTFGRNALGAFRRTFGVLGQRGGERRLNVAVTRARQRIVVVTSIPVAEVSDFLTTRRGPASPRDYLQAYLDYARAVSTGDLDSARSLRARFTASGHSAGTTSPEADGLTRSVEAFIRALGYQPVPTDPDPALAVDFAIVHAQTGMFGIGIECAAPEHRLLRRARAREIWRPAVLSRAYPFVHKVSAHGWYHDPENERRRLASAIEAALAPAPRPGAEPRLEAAL